LTRFDAYVLCTSPRSGSTLLCNLLAKTGVSGKPDSWFHTPSVSDWLQQFDLTIDKTATACGNLERAIDAAIAAGSSNNGIFALRLQRHSFDFFTQQLSILRPGLSNDFQRISAVFGRVGFIYLTRLDKISQAVSIVKAEQTGLWHKAADGSELERLAPPAPPRYDARRIAAAVEQMQTWDGEWTRWFARESIEPLAIEYERLAQDSQRVLRDILAYLAVDTTHARGVVAGVAKLGDDVSREWVARFRREYGCS